MYANTYIGLLCLGESVVIFPQSSYNPPQHSAFSGNPYLNNDTSSLCIGFALPYRQFSVWSYHTVQGVILTSVLGANDQGVIHAGESFTPLTLERGVASMSAAWTSGKRKELMNLKSEAWHLPPPADST